MAGRGKKGEDALARVRAAALASASARRRRDGTIREAWRAGHSVRDIAKAAGLSVARIGQIVQAGR